MGGASIKFIALLALTSVSISCGKFERFENREDGFTAVRFSSESGSGGDFENKVSLNGGVMAYIFGEGGLTKKTIKLDNESSSGASAVHLLPNGSYNFLALGYTIAGMQGEIRCAKASNGNPVVLTGVATTINLNLSVANCYSSVFSGDSSFHSVSNPNPFNPFQMFSCASSFNQVTATGSSVCTGDKGRLHKFRSAKILLLGYEAEGAYREGTSIESNCIPGSGIPGSMAATATGTSSGYQAVVTHGSDTIVYGGQSGEMLLSTNGGTSYSIPTAGTDNRQAKSNGTTIVMSSTTGVWVSSDGGATYTQRQSGTSFWGIDISGTKVAAGVHPGSGAVHVSTDSGVTYTITSSGLGANIESVFIHPTTGDIYVAGGGNVRKSTDNGATWSTFASGFNTINWFEIIGNYVFVGDGVGLHISTNGGSSYTDYCNTGCANVGTLPNNSVGDVHMVGKTLYAATGSGVAVVPNIDVLSTFSATNVIGTGQDIFQLAYRQGTIYFAAYGTSTAARKSDGLSNGAAFPGTPINFLPLGDAAPVRPFAIRVKTYLDANCEVFNQNKDFPNGLFNVNGTTNNAPYINSSSTLSKFFLVDP
jgi:hypothetical protein